MGPSKGVGDLTEVFSKIYQNYSNRGKGRSEDAKEAKQARKDAKAEAKAQAQNPTPTPTPPTPTSTSPTTTTPTTPTTPATTPTEVTKSKVDSDLFSLAGRYVENYEDKAGKTLSADQKKALVQEVYSFYSEPSRAGRLAAVVNA